MPRKALAGPAGEPRLHDQSRRYSQRPTQEHRVSERGRAADALHRACAQGIERGGRAAQRTSRCPHRYGKGTIMSTAPPPASASPQGTTQPRRQHDADSGRGT
jgi:hypothetical protein